MSEDTSPATTRLDDELARTLLEQRTLVMNGVLDDTLGNRLCNGLFVLSARDPTPTSGCGSTPRVARCRPCSRSAT